MAFEAEEEIASRRSHPAARATAGVKFLTFPALLAAALFGIVVVVPFQVGPKTTPTGRFALEVSMTSTRPGFVQVYYRDVTGALSETASSKLPLVQSSTARTYRLPLPAGRLADMRLDPLSRAGSVAFESIRVVSRSGRVVRPIRFSEITAGQQIGSLEERAGRLEIATTSAGDDPQLTITLTPPLELNASWIDAFSGFWLSAGTVFLGLVGLFVGLDRAARGRAILLRTLRRLADRPRRAVALAAIIAVVASAYPIVFLGKSHVSPNFGTPLLYEDIPTLPGVVSTGLVNPRGADVGAMMWAHLPYSVVEHRAVMSGELPLWNRYNSLGTPLLGQGQSMIGDPLQAPVVLAKGAAWAWDLKYLVAKGLFGLGLGLLVLGLTGHLPAALIVSIAAPFIGFFVFRINHAAYFSLCYAPWPLYCWLQLAQATHRRAIAGWATGLLVANLALLNSGTVKEASMLLLTMNVSGAGVLWSSVMTWRMRLGRMAVAGWAGLILILLTAPGWATFLHTLRNAQTNYDVAAAFQIQPSLLLGAFDEAFFRLIMPAEVVFNPAINFLLLLGLLYFIVTLRSHRTERAVMALAVSAVPPFALVFGLVPPSWIVALPFLGRVQHIDNCFLCALVVLWSVLAGVGFARAATRLGTAEGRGDLIAVSVWLIGIVGAWIAFRQTVHRGAFGPGTTFSVLPPGQVLPVSQFVWVYLGSLLVASGVLMFLVRRALLRRTFGPAAGVLTALCVILLLWRNGLHAESVGFERHVVRPPARANVHAASPTVEFLRAAQSVEPGRGFGLRDNFFPGWTGIYGLEGINGPDALMNPWFRDLISVSGTTRGVSWDFTVPPEKVADVRPVFDAFNVRYYLNRGHDEDVLSRFLKSSKVLDLDVWESPTTWPRAFFTDRVALYDTPADLVQSIKSGDGRPFAAVERKARSVLPSLGNDLGGRTVIAAKNYRLTENTTAFDIRANAPGVIVLSETFWPGDFRAELNGRKTPVLRLNHAFKGVVVDAAGDYRVLFRYVPRNFPRNLLLCATGAALLALSLLFGLRRTRRRTLELSSHL